MSKQTTYRGYGIRTVKYIDADGFNAEVQDDHYHPWEDVSCDIGLSEDEAIKAAKEWIDAMIRDGEEFADEAL